MDEDPLSKGFAFEVGHLWHKSVFENEQNNGSLFKTLETDLPELEFRLPHEQYQPDLQLPQFGDVGIFGGRELEHVDSDVASPAAFATGSEDKSQDPSEDVWALDLVLDDREAAPYLHTWEAFEKKDVPEAARTAYLSEAGPQAFDAVLSENRTSETNSGVLPQDVMFRALCNLALGRSSVFFQWNMSKKAFVQTLNDIPISAHSIICSDSFTQKLIDFGSTYRSLADFASSTASLRRSCTAMVAFKGCLTNILDSIEGHITMQFYQIRSLLQLQSLTEHSHHLIEFLGRLVQLVRDLYTDEEVISIACASVYQFVDSANCFSGTMQEVLSRLSAPWLERLCIELGMRRDPTGSLVVESFDSREDISEVSGASFDLGGTKAGSLPALVDLEDRTLINETKSALKVLRQHVPDPGVACQSGEWTNEHVSMTRSSRPLYDIALPLQDADGETRAWAGDDEQHDYLAALDAQMSRPLGTTEKVSDALRQLVISAIQSPSREESEDCVFLMQHFDFNPLERLRPVIQSHNRSINRQLLRYLFRDYRLRHHLDLQRQYQLFGNGDFVARLAKAFFSTETQSAERRRGTIPTGETLGLRLGAREKQQWPPASSELQLTLMGVLTETYRPEAGSGTYKKRVKELPGGLGFSIRELPDDEIEKVMDSASIYALDFLKLQYTPPPPLDTIITPSAMQAYDSVFRFLLRMLRVLHVTTRLRETYGIDPSNLEQRASSVARSALEAHYFISVLFSHVMDIGIAAPYETFNSSLGAVEKDLETDDDNFPSRSPVGLDGVRKLHENCLERIRSRLFLRQKQEKLRNGLEDALTGILSCASNSEAGATIDVRSDLDVFKKSVKDFIKLLKAALDKPPKVSAMNEADKEDTESMKILLTRLEWNEFYSTDTPSW